jgi:RHS repeat-associated protein
VYDLDDRGAVTSITDPTGRVTTFEVNAMGLVSGITDPAQKKTTIEYAGSDPIKVTDPLGRTTLTAFDAVGRPIRTVDPRGAITDTTYTVTDLVRSVTDPLGRTTEFDYNPNGYLETVTDPRDSVTTFAYDNMDRVTTVTDPLGAAETMAYDANGNLTRHTSRRGIITEHDYDELDRRTTSRFGTESTVSYGYDAANRLRRTEDSQVGVSTLDYDGLDRIISETGPHGEVSYSYSDTVRDRTMTVSDGPTIRHVYDAAGNLAEIQRDGTTVTAIERDTVGRPSRVGVLDDGVHQVYGYDDADQITSITYRAGATVLGDLSTSYDGAGNPTRTTGAWSRTLLPATFGPATYDAANRLTAIGDTAVTYDADGNLTSDGETSYTWDARGRLSGLSRTGLSATFGYTADGRRIDRTINGTTTNYLYDGVNPLQEKVNGAVTATTIAAGVDAWQVRESGGTTKRYLTDPVGSTLGLVDNTGTGAAYAYGPFGTTEVTGDDAGNPYRYTGREDDNTGLYYYRTRYYSPTLQRFISEDPIGLASGDTNPYAYVFNQPTVLVDPIGTKPRGSCLGNSFVPGTEVQMADGSRRRIEDVKPGDQVLATDPETGRTAARTVTATITGEGEKHLVDISVDNDGDHTADGTVTATDGHPFWVADVRQWRDAKDIKPGDLLRTSAGTYVQVTTVAQRTAAQQVHNLTVDDLHTYYVIAGNVPVLVHNVGEGCVVNQTLGAGAHAREGVGLVDGNINAPGVRGLVNEAGNAYGCHVCGSTNPGTRSGNWIPDHQPPTTTVAPGTPQTAYPHCLPCARQQGGIVRQLNEGNYDFFP